MDVGGLPLPPASIWQTIGPAASALLLAMLIVGVIWIQVRKKSSNGNGGEQLTATGIAMAVASALDERRREDSAVQLKEMLDHERTEIPILQKIADQQARTAEAMERLEHRLDQADVIERLESAARRQRRTRG